VATLAAAGLVCGAMLVSGCSAPGGQRGTGPADSAESAGSTGGSEGASDTGRIEGTGTAASSAAASDFSPTNPLLPAEPTGQVSDAISLVGLWQVTGAEGETPGTWLRIGIDAGGQSYYLFRDCGYLTAGWAASGTRFLVGGIGGSESCFRQPDGTFEAPTADWLTDARAFEQLDGGGIDLLDDAGSRLAHLAPGVGAPPTNPDVWEGVRTPPVVDDTVRETLRSAAPLREGLVAATEDDLVGTWETVPDPGMALPPRAPVPGATPPPGFPEVATLTLDADGTFQIDDCVSAMPVSPLEGEVAQDSAEPGAATPDAAGPDSPAAAANDWPGLPWTGDGNDFLVPGFARNSVLCFPSWSGWETRARTIALDNGYLRLFDVDGAELQRWQRADH
jgi:hypothetical protein